ncbi:glycosyltransferase [Neoroseomonas rubea]|uniref:glycosyltransferase n=1 Tax=Neoroseomonas rubea TaxID=2748666 RepID=UPI0018E00E66
MTAAVPGTIALLAGLAWLAGVVWFLRHFRAPSVAAEGRVSLLLAVTGRTDGLPPLLAALARQTLRPRRLIAAVESEADPAFAQLRELAPRLPFPVEIVVAGLDESRSQKATNLIAGLRRIDDQDDALVLLDADILPQDQWLSWLATPALNGTAEVVTGYRWHALDGAGPARHLVAWLDRALALGPRFVASGLVWGGSVALSRAAIARMNLEGALARTFSTDGAISRRARALHLRVLTRRAVLVPTPPEGGDREAIAFKRRQLQIVRVYVPRLWWLLGAVLAMEAAAVALLVMALAGDAAALAWLLPPCAIGLARALLQDRVTRAVGIREGGVARAAQWLAGAAVPLTAPLVLLLFATSARTRVIRWRHVEYEVLGPDRVRVLRRHPHGASA